MKVCEAGCTCGRHSPKPERAARISAARRGQALSHGLTHHPLYLTWKNMMARCYGKRPDSANWQGRGITVCEQWQNVADFIAWMESGDGLGTRPEGMSFDRIDNDGNYEPGNVRWASRSEQNSNRRAMTRSG